MELKLNIFVSNTDRNIIFVPIHINAENINENQKFDINHNKSQYTHIT